MEINRRAADQQRGLKQLTRSLSPNDTQEDRGLKRTRVVWPDKLCGLQEIGDPIGEPGWNDCMGSLKDGYERRELCVGTDSPELVVNEGRTEWGR